MVGRTGAGKSSLVVGLLRLARAVRLESPGYPPPPPVVHAGARPCRGLGFGLGVPKLFAPKVGQKSANVRAFFGTFFWE